MINKKFLIIWFLIVFAIALLFEFNTTTKPKEVIKFIVSNPGLFSNKGNCQDTLVILDLIERAQRQNWKADRLLQILKLANIDYEIREASSHIMWIDVFANDKVYHIGTDQDRRIFSYWHNN